MIFFINGSEYSIDIIENIIFNRYTNQVLESNNGLFSIYINQQKIVKDIIWFKHFAILGINLPFDYKNINTIRFEKIKLYGIQNIRNYSYIPINDYNYEININNKIYRLILRYSNYAISNDGEVINIKNGRSLKIIFSNHMEYNYLNLMDNYMFSHPVSISQHRLIGFAWIKNEDWHMCNVIDHIDKNKQNNNIYNLRWVSAGMNVALRDDNMAISVLVYNIDTKDEIYCMSLSEAQRVINNKSPLSLYDIKDIKRVFITNKGRFLIKDVSSREPWPEIEDCKDGNISFTKDGKTKYYKNLEEIANEYNITRKYINIKRLMKDIPGSFIKDEYRNNKHTKINIKNIHTNKLYSFDSVSECSKFLNVSESVIYQRLSGRVNVLINNEWYVVTKNNNVNINKNLPKKIKLYNKEEILIFNSKKEAGRYLKTCNHIINKYLDKDEPYNYKGKRYFIKSV